MCHLREKAASSPVEFMPGEAYRVVPAALLLLALRAHAGYQPAASTRPRADPLVRAIDSLPPTVPSSLVPDAPLRPLTWPPEGESTGRRRPPSEYELTVGRVVDTLRSDYPELLSREPDLSIYTEEVMFTDPSGLRLRGKDKYRRVFEGLRFLRTTVMRDAEITYRLVVVDATVRVRWNAKLWVRDMIGHPTLVHVDGVSVYELDEGGNVSAHRVENIELTGAERRAIDFAFGLAWPVPELATEGNLAIPYFRALSELGVDSHLPRGTEREGKAEGEPRGPLDFGLG